VAKIGTVLQQTFEEIHHCKMAYFMGVFCNKMHLPYHLSYQCFIIAQSLTEIIHCHLNVTVGTLQVIWLITKHCVVMMTQN